MSRVITQSVNNPLSYPTEKLAGIITQSLRVQQISKHLTQANRMSIFNRRTCGWRYMSPKTLMHLTGSETRVIPPSRYRSMARGWLSWLCPGCPHHFPSGYTTLTPTTGGSVIVLPPHKVKTLKTLHFSASAHYQHFPTPFQKAPQLAGSAPISKASCHTCMSGSPAYWVAAYCFVQIPAPKGSIILWF